MIEMKKVNFTYNNANAETLLDINLTVEEGEVLAVVGPSGGGKSTLLRVLAGLEKPQKGSIRLADEIIVDRHVFAQPDKRGIGMVFQDYALFQHMTVGKNIEFGISKMGWRSRKHRLKEVLELVDLAGYENRYPHELSGGQQQRIALARALAPQPKILLLDEPFSNLDTHLLEKVREELFQIIRRIGITTIMVTHNPGDAKTQADRIISIVKGEVQQMAS
jgi:iron(III) transport system ATP-binding protein